MKKTVFSKSLLASQGCALTNFRLEFLRMIFLNLRRAVGTRISFILMGSFYDPEFEVRSYSFREIRNAGIVYGRAGCEALFCVQQNPQCQEMMLGSENAFGSYSSGEVSTRK